MNEPLSPEEVREMSEHLGFLKRHKSVLALSLNATEDLLVNGVKPPSDRGVCKHLLSKVDRKLVERVLAKDVVQRDPALRARLLAGIVRIDPDPGMLLFYLEALAGIADKREAAAAFALTIDRIDFASLSNAQTATLLDVTARTFQGHDRVQVLFGLLASESFERTLERALPALPEALRGIFGALRAAYRHVVLGLAPADDAERARIEEGVATWLSAPDAVLRSYPQEVRERLASFAAEQADVSSGGKAAIALVDSLGHAEPAYAQLACVLADRLVMAGREDQARSLYNQVLQAHPKLARASRRRDALGWPRTGRLALQPGGDGGGSRLVRAYWLDAAAFVLARVVAPRDAERLAREAALHAGLLVPGVAACLGRGAAPDGRAFVVIAPGGRPLDVRQLERWSLADTLALAAHAARILLAVAQAGVELPDAAPTRLLVEGGAPHGVRLADLDGAVRAERGRCLARHAEHARELTRRLLAARGAAASAGLPLAVRAALGAPRSLESLVASLDALAARFAET